VHCLPIRKHERPSGELAALRIYEAHAGMSSEEPVVATYTYFKGVPTLPVPCTSIFLHPPEVHRSEYKGGLTPVPGQKAGELKGVQQQACQTQC